MRELLRLITQGRPGWGAIMVLLAVGVGFVGFGNGDRLLWTLTSHGAETPGVVVDIRSYRGPEDSFVTYVPKVAFRDERGKVRLMEARGGSRHYDLRPDQPVYVMWQPDRSGVVIDVPFKRRFATSVILSFLTAIGTTAWLWGIWLLVRRIYASGEGSVKLRRM